MMGSAGLPGMPIEEVAARAGGRGRAYAALAAEFPGGRSGRFPGGTAG